MKIEIQSSKFLARYKVHKLRIFLYANWHELFDLVPVALRGKAKTVATSKSHNFLGTLLCGAGGVSKWSRARLTNNADISKDALAAMRDNPKSIVTVFDEENGFAKSQQVYDEIIEKSYEIFKAGFDWDEEEFEWKIGVPSRRAWPLVNVLCPNLLPGFAGSKWFFYKYKKWQGEEGMERMVLTISPEKDELGFYSAVIKGQGIDDSELFDLFSGLVFTDKQGRTAFLLSDFQNLFANINLFTDKGDRFFGTDIATGHFSYMSYSVGTNMTLTKTIVLKRETGDKVLMPKRFIRIAETDDQDLTEKAICFYLKHKASTRLSSINEPIHTSKFFVAWVQENYGPLQ